MGAGSSGEMRMFWHGTEVGGPNTECATCHCIVHFKTFYFMLCECLLPCTQKATAWGDDGDLSLALLSEQKKYVAVRDGRGRRRRRS